MAEAENFPLPQKDLTPNEKSGFFRDKYAKIKNHFKRPHSSKPASVNQEFVQAGEFDEAFSPKIKIPDQKEPIPKIPDRPHGSGSKLSELLIQSNVEGTSSNEGGVLAIIGTNETVGSGFFEAVQDKKPDGYVVGVGDGNVFTMLHCFPDNVVPKGIVTADIDPRSVASGKLLINKIKQSNSAEQLNAAFFNISDNDFNTAFQEIIEVEENPSLKEVWQKLGEKERDQILKGIRKKEYFSWHFNRLYETEGQNIDVMGAILDKFAILKQLAEEDNISISWADFTDPKFISAVNQLPDFDNSTNIIYSSNIVDHITQRGTQTENARVFEHLRVYEQGAQKPIFIDTLGVKLNYFLRARSTLPTFSQEDFPYDLSMQPRSRKPEDLLFADAA